MAVEGEGDVEGDVEGEGEGEGDIEGDVDLDLGVDLGVDLDLDLEVALDLDLRRRIPSSVAMRLGSAPEVAAMKRIDLRARILLAVGTGSTVAIACGGTEAISPTGDAGADATTGSTDSGQDVSDGQPMDSKGDACSGTGGRCTSDLDCCPQGGLRCALSDPCIAQGNCTCLPSCVDVCVLPGQPCHQACECCNFNCQGTEFSDGGACFQTIRRPFLVGSSLRKSDLVDRSDWLPSSPLSPAHDLDPGTARALALDWLRDASEEHASIAAFARFTLHLLSVGAPPDLVLASQRAARDEVRHAEACFALARRYGGKSLGPAPLSLDGALTPMTLADVAALTAEEGCVGETLGALLAEELLSRDLDPVVRATLTRANLAVDEARHAELAWRFVAWAVARGGDSVRRAVARAIDRAVAQTLVMPVRTYDGIDRVAWRAHGRFTCAEARAIAERGIETIIRPARSALLADTNRRASEPDRCSRDRERRARSHVPSSA